MADEFKGVIAAPDADGGVTDTTVWFFDGNGLARVREKEGFLLVCAGQLAERARQGDVNDEEQNRSRMCTDWPDG